MSNHLLAVAKRTETTSATHLVITGARYASMVGTSFVFDGEQSPRWDLNIHLTAEHAAKLCAALRELRDADHEAALAEHAARLQTIAVMTTPEFAGAVEEAA